MSLELDLTREKDKDIMLALRETQLPNIRKLFIQGLSGIRTDEENFGFLSFLRHSLPENLPTFSLYNDSGSNWRNLEDYFEPLERCIKTVKKEVYIFGFRIKATTLVRLLQSCHKVERLSLVNCEIKDGDYTLPQSTRYHIKSLNLSSNTCDKEDDDCLNYTKLNKLFTAISKTNMCSSLKEVFINGDRFPIDELEEILATAGFIETSVVWKYS